MIGRGTWIDKLAYDMIQREKSLGRDIDKTIIVESGLGASGIPHVGSLGDAVRSYGVKMALNDMGYDSELLAYSDDLDGLRKIPDGFPKSLEDFVGQPVSLIPDPFGSYDSYADHMSRILLDGLDRLGIQYKSQRAFDAYKDGLLYKQIHTILKQADYIGQKIKDIVGQDKYVKSLPYFAVCEKCHKIYTTDSYEYDASSYMVRYRCVDIVIGGRVISGCGHRGMVNIRGGLGKLAWKVEFAARWSAFDVRFEAYGKDIMDSVSVNDWISEHILGYAPPHHVRYEMFLDRGGKKISKSKGNVVTAQDWLDVGTPQSLLLLMYKRIQGARRLGLEDVPALMNEYDELENTYFGVTKMDNLDKAVRLRGLYEYVNLLRPPDSICPHVSYTLLVELAKIYTGDSRTEQILQKLDTYSKLPKDTSPIIHLIKLACRFADEYGHVEREEIQLNADVIPAISTLITSLKDSPDIDSQEMIYSAAKSHDIKPRTLFEALYLIILGTRRGPRLGPLISDMGASNVIRMLQRYVPANRYGPQ